MRHLIAAGSTPGRLHLLADRPSQDAFRLLQGGFGAVAVVCDGCGSERGSGLGAALGASLAAVAAARELEAGRGLDLARIRARVLDGIAATARLGRLDLRENFLFTLLGAAFAGERATVFACGDGVAAVDGAVRRLGPFPENAPPYLAYAFEDPGVGLTLLYDGPAESVLIGTDGAADAPLSPFWTQERYLYHPDLLRRSLKLLRPPDDATIAVMRRIP